MYIGSQEITRGGAQYAFRFDHARFGRSGWFFELDGADGSHAFLNIIKHLRAMIEVRQPRTFGLIQGHIRFRLLGNISHLPSGIFLLLSGASLAGPGWRSRVKVDVSVLAVRYRAFVFAAPEYFSTGNRLVRCREPFLLVRFQADTATSPKNSYRCFEGEFFNRRLV